MARKPICHWPRPQAWAAVILLLPLCGPAVAQGVRVSAILDLARGADAQFAAARAAADSGREKLPQARAAMWPTASLTASVKGNRDGSTAYEGLRSYEASGAALVVSQPLFRLGIKAGVEQAEFQVRLAEQQLALAEQELFMRTVRGYFDVLQAADELAAAGAQKDALTQQLTQARRSFEVGTVPITDLYEAQARRDLAGAQEIAARNELESRKRILERLIARPLPALARLLPTAGIELLSAAQAQELVDSAPRTALPVLIAGMQAQVAEKEIARREAGHHPTLDLVATMGANRNVAYGSFGGNDTRQSSIGIEFNLPISQGGAVSSRTREAIADRMRADAERLHTERQALLDAQQAQLGVQSGVALTQALQQALKSSESQLVSTQRGLQVGTRTRVDVLNAEQQVFATRKDLAGARYRTLVSALALKAAAGMLNEGDLRSLDALLGD